MGFRRSWEIGQGLAQSFLVNRLVRYCHGVTLSLYEPHFSGSRMDRFKLLEQIPIGRRLDIKTIAWLGSGQDHALFVVCNDCHSGIILSLTLVFNLLMSAEALPASLILIGSWRGSSDALKVPCCNAA